jgi:hypothetical protein
MILYLRIFDTDTDFDFDKAFSTVLILDPHFHGDDKREAAFSGQQ